MAVTITLVSKVKSLEHIERVYKAVLSAGYDATAGQVFDFTAATDPKKLGRYLPPSKPLPSNDEIAIQQAPLGFTAELKQAAASPTLKNFVLRVFNIATAAELTTANYPAGAINNAVYIRVRTRRRNG